MKLKNIKKFMNLSKKIKINIFKIYSRKDIN